jgi:hypothetical protein
MSDCNCRFLVEIYVSVLTLFGVQLSEALSKSHVKKTELVITKLILHTVRTQVVTAIPSFASFILYQTMPDNFMFYTPVFITGEL